MVSPTVATELVFLTAVIDVHMGGDIAYFDIRWAFLHVDSNEDITVVLKGWLVVQVAPNLYQKYITIDKKNTKILTKKM